MTSIKSFENTKSNSFLNVSTSIISGLDGESCASKYFHSELFKTNKSGPLHHKNAQIKA